MARRHLITLNGTDFPSKKALLQHVRAIRDAYRDGEPVKPEHVEFMAELIRQRHRHAKRKFCGPNGEDGAIVGMTVERTEWGSRCFRLYREDGTSTDVSYMECINPTPPEKDLRLACRTAIRDQIVTFKQAYFAPYEKAVQDKVDRGSVGGDDGAFSHPIIRVPCQATGRLITWAEADVDHVAPTFEEIVQGFINDTGVDPATVETTGRDDNEYSVAFVGEALARQFAEYHQRRANLRVVCKRFNLSRRRKSTQPPPVG